MPFTFKKKLLITCQTVTGVPKAALYLYELFTSLNTKTLFKKKKIDIILACNIIYIPCV